VHKGHYYYGEVQEVDVMTGKLLFSWRSDRHVNFHESYVAPSKDGRGTWDYFHINSINIDPSDGNLVISATQLLGLLQGEPQRRGTHVAPRRQGERLLDGAGTHFAFQHDVTPYGGGVYTVFDNESTPAVRPPSRALVLHVNEARRSTTLLHQYHHSPPVTSSALGSVQMLPDGHVFVGWEPPPTSPSTKPSGRVLYDGRLDVKGLVSYRAFKQPWSGLPSEPPALAVERSPDTTVLYMSWNGATGVARWRVLAAGRLAACRR